MIMWQERLYKIGNINWTTMREEKYAGKLVEKIYKGYDQFGSYEVIYKKSEHRHFFPSQDTQTKFEYCNWDKEYNELETEWHDGWNAAVEWVNTRRARLIEEMLEFYCYAGEEHILLKGVNHD